MTLHPGAGPSLIVGLGNPGPRYAATRHNVGYRVVDELAGRAQVAFRTAAAAYDIAEIELADHEVHLIKPRTYMNRSGAALLAWSLCYGRGFCVDDPAAEDSQCRQDAVVLEDPIPPEDTNRPIVVCDDLALPLGTLRLRARGSDGGQKGLASIIAALGGSSFPRLRLGIAGGDEAIPPDAWADYVLDDFLPDEAEIVDAMVLLAADALTELLNSDLETAASRYNRRR